MLGSLENIENEMSLGNLGDKSLFLNLNMIFNPKICEKLNSNV
jgi:hypothetical protein